MKGARGWIKRPKELPIFAGDPNSVVMVGSVFPGEVRYLRALGVQVEMRLLEHEHIEDDSVVHTDIPFWVLALGEAGEDLAFLFKDNAGPRRARLLGWRAIERLARRPELRAPVEAAARLRAEPGALLALALGLSQPVEIRPRASAKE